VSDATSFNNIFHLSGRQRVYSPYALLNETLCEETTYRKYITTDPVERLDPNYIDISKLENTSLLYTTENAEVSLTGQCPHCKKTIKYFAPTNELNIFGKIFSDDQLKSFQTTIATMKFLINALKRLFIDIDYVNVFKYVMIITTFSTSMIPWIWLGRNIPEYYKIFDIPPFLSPLECGDLIILASEKPSYASAYSWYQLIYLSIGLSNGSLPSLLRFCALAFRMVNDVLYSATFNLAYSYLAFEINPLVKYFLVDNSMNSESKNKDHKNLTFLDILRSSFESSPKKLISNDDEDMSFNADHLALMNHLKFYTPLKSLLLTIGGTYIGHNIIGKCKPVVKCLYRIFKNYSPKPTEIEMCFEYMGYQVVLLLWEIYDFFYCYFEVKSNKTFKVLPTIPEKKFKNVE
jgi:hypothetical protein